MIRINLITVGKLKEKYWRDAAAEYSKRLGAFCKLEIVELNESRLSDNPSEKEIAAALENEAKATLTSRVHTILQCALRASSFQVKSCPKSSANAV